MKRTSVLKPTAVSTLLTVGLLLLPEAALAADTGCVSDAGIPHGVIAPIDMGHLRKVETLSNITRRGFYPAQVAAGVVTKGKPKYTGFHALRHFYASWLINRRADGGRELPPKTVQERLGHSSITLTLDRYGHLFPASEDHEIDAAELALVTA